MHEKNTGRTSSITSKYMKLNDKTYSFVDLAGHEKYLGTTITGISNNMIDYALILIGANVGNFPRVAKEHVGLALSFNIPLIFIITKMDMPSQHIIEQTIKKTKKIMSSRAAKNKILYEIESDNDIKQIRELITYHGINKVCPMFKISNTTGKNLNLLKKYLGSLEINPKWGKLCKDQPLYLIDGIYQIDGIGLVVSGIVKSGVINKNDILQIGPFHGKYLNVTIKSIHNNFRDEINQLVAGKSGCFWIKLKDKISRDKIKRGMVIVDNKNCAIGFHAEVNILHHPTTIRLNYQPVIHCMNIKQVAKIISIKDKNNKNINMLRSGDKAVVTFMFMYHPVHLEKDVNFVFREGKTKGIGKITKLLFK